MVLYEMLTGSAPFGGDSLETLLHAVLNQPPEPPSRRRPDVPAGLDRVVLKMLAKEPPGRYSCAAALIRDLEGLGVLTSMAVRVTRRSPATPASMPPQPAAPPSAPVSAIVLAVVPFQDASPPGEKRPRAHAFARGLAETVSARLASVPGVHIVPPSALPPGLRSADRDALERELGVSLVLSGSVQRVGQQIRLGFSLVGRQRVQVAGGRDLGPSNPNLWGNLADAYRWTPGLEDQAGPTFDRAIALKRRRLAVNRRDGKGWAELGNWLAKRGRLKPALRAVERALALVPQDVTCMAHAVRVFHLAGDREAALEWLGNAVRCGYDIAELERDPDLATLRGDPRFKRIVRGRRSRPSGT